MSASGSAEIPVLSPGLAAKLWSFTARAAAQPDVKAAVEANHDDNRWWPLYVRDWRLRMAVAGWSARVSYAMIGTYSGVVAHADALGWDKLTALEDDALGVLVRPIGLPAARIRYLRSLARLIDQAPSAGIDLPAAAPGDLVEFITTGVDGASYNTAQCAVLYARGYHCGVIPVDSGMVTKLAPLLGISLRTGPVAHEQLRRILERHVVADAARYRDLASRLGYEIAVPPGVAPTWFAHLVLIYFKRLYLNRPRPGLCPRRPACPDLFGCTCPPAGSMR